MLMGTGLAFADDCVNYDSPALTALKEFIAAYEAGNLPLIRERLDPSMLGLQSLIDGIVEDSNKHKQIRLLVKDIQLQCGPDVTAIQFGWEKRFLDVNTFAPGLFQGRASVLMHRSRGAWNIAAIAGDNPFATRRGVLGRLDFFPGVGFVLGKVKLTPVALDLVIEVVDPDIAGLGTLKVQVVTSGGDVEMLDLAESGPGRFRRTSVPVSSAPAMPGNGVLELANGISLTARYVDRNPGHNLPPTLLTRSFKIGGGLPAPNDTTPDAFAFAAVTQAPLSSSITSNTVVINGIDVAIPVSIAGGAYSINGAPFTGAPGAISNGQAIAVRLTSAATASTNVSAALTVGTVVAPFSVTTLTLVPDTTPDPFAFNAVTGAPINTPITSNGVTIGGINAATPVSIVGGSYSINGAPFTTSAGSIASGQTIALQLQSSAGLGITTSATVTIGGVSAVFNVTTLSTIVDTTPNPFAFAPQNNVPPGASVTSAPAAISGINAPAPVSIAGGSYSINGGPFTTAASTISNGQSVTVQVISSALGNGTGTASATLNVGGVSAAFTVGTWDQVPNAYGFPTVNTFSTGAPPCVNPASQYTTAPAVISGITGMAPVAVVFSAPTPNPANARVSINGGAFTAGPTTIANGQTIAVRFNSVGAVGAFGGPTVRATINIGGVTADVMQTCT